MELSEHKLNLLERMTLKSYELKKSLKKIHTFGKTKISLLFIPHSNENIVKVEISHYTLGFLFLIIVSLLSLGLSFFGYYLYTRNDHQDIYNRGNTEKVFFLHHDLMGDILENTIDDLASETEDLYKVTGKGRFGIRRQTKKWDLSKMNPKK
jgi:hypothetical protein